ncbi:putative cyclic nucleotide-gated ion channel 13 isoform B [Glycine soja]|uniref:Putative cyclic nucleotide-gated ion channel 13 isoform B n=1 Tax=Glycine soja TaxID=3848 RepID=A0A445LHH3_GLYSO|nr:putative cyclic nucleotide-gated ion channel 13 isoform B [Glycine soja]
MLHSFTDKNTFNFGIFFDALDSGVVESTTVLYQKFFYCFWWGLGSLRKEMRVKRHDIELWMSHRMLPEFLKERIRRNEQYKWQENRGVDEETLIRNLPRYLRRDLKRHFCLDLVKRVPMFEEMDQQLLDTMCDSLKDSPLC